MNKWIALFATVLSVLVSSAKAEDELMPLYAFSLHPPYIDTIVDVNKYVRIAPDRQSQRGYLWGKTPFTPNSWVIDFEFKVHGASNNLYGDGFAFWYITDKRDQGPVFGSKDEFNGLGIFFDTYSNGRHRHSFPYVTAMLGDGKTKYDASTDGKTNEIGGCSADFRSKDYTTRARIRYHSNALLEVLLDVKGTGVFESCFKVEDISLPTLGYLGFSSHTGDASDNHDIIRISANSILNAKTKPPPSSNNNNNNGNSNSGQSKPQITNKAQTGSKSSGMGAFGSFMFVIFILAILIAIGAAIFVALNKMKTPKAYKRF
ncbi:hypothetical protein HDU76_012958 [Blyttiomyces sp. JEL0837]|nr:hypothetical protein HDU76_012958 [Blyttiomyces sp. JEL0837]